MNEPLNEENLRHDDEPKMQMNREMKTIFKKEDNTENENQCKQ